MIRLKTLALVAFAAATLIVPVTAFAPVTIKLATVAPKSSSFYSALTDMGAAWTRATQAPVKLTIYPDGVQGTETEVISMMQDKQLHGALLMLPGLTQIDDGFNVFSIPFFFQTDEELSYVQQKLAPQLARRAEAKGFHIVNWGSAGWVTVFSKQSIKTIDQLKQAKLFTSQGDDRMVQWYKSNGFHPTALASGDMVGSLTTGLIDAVPIPPYPASRLQLHTTAKFMLELRLAPLVVATVISNDVWNKITPEDRAKMQAAAEIMEKRLMAEAPTQETVAIREMVNRGLTVTRLDAQATADFRAEGEKLKATMSTTMMPKAKDIYDLALAERDAFRKLKK